MPYDEAQLCAGPLTYGAKAYYNAAVRMSTNAEAYHNAEAYESNQISPDAGHSQINVAINEVHTPPCETNEFGLNAKRPRAVACSYPGLMSLDTKRPYDEGHLYVA